MIEKTYALAQARYAELGVDTEQALTILNGVASLTAAQRPSVPPVKDAVLMVAVPSALITPVNVAEQASVGKPDADMLVEPVTVMVPAGPVKDEANAGPAIAMHATAAKSAPIFLMIILSRSSFFGTRSGSYVPDG